MKLEKKIYVDINYSNIVSGSYHNILTAEIVSLAVSVNKKIYYFERNDIDFGEAFKENPKLLNKLLFFGQEENTISFVNKAGNIIYYRDTYENIKEILYNKLRDEGIDFNSNINIFGDLDVTAQSLVNALFNEIIKDKIFLFGKGNEETKNAFPDFNVSFITYYAFKYMITHVNKEAIASRLEEVEKEIFNKDEERPCLVHLSNIKTLMEILE